jgi:hypothetical protein
MGGRVEIDSTPHVGTTVTLWLQESECGRQSVDRAGIPGSNTSARSAA